MKHISGLHWPVQLLGDGGEEGEDLALLGGEPLQPPLHGRQLAARRLPEHSARPREPRGKEQESLAAAAQAQDLGTCLVHCWSGQSSGAVQL